jgi:hypothetical protein
MLTVGLYLEKDLIEPPEDPREGWRASNILLRT